MTYLFELAQSGTVKIDEVDLDKYKLWLAGIYTNDCGYVRLMVWPGSFRNQQYLLSRLILNPPPGMLADHCNRDTLDVRRSNLRPATYAQNSANRGTMSNNTTGFRGVSYNKRRKKYEAYISFEGTKYSLGHHEFAEDAARAYDAAAARKHGEFAVLNFKPT